MAETVEGCPFTSCQQRAPLPELRAVAEAAKRLVEGWPRLTDLPHQTLVRDLRAAVARLVASDA